MNWRHLEPAKIRDNGRHFYVFRYLSYHELLVCYIQIIYIILKFCFVWLSAPVLDQTFVNNRGDSSPKCWKNDDFFKNMKISIFQSKTFPFQEFKIVNFWKSYFFENIPVSIVLTTSKCLQHNIEKWWIFEFSWKYEEKI